MLVHESISSKSALKKRRGAGLINSVINSLPIELHLPGYQFCGPGTKLDQRLARGDQGINPLDASCKSHDLAYRDSSDLESRHQADRILAESAFKRVTSKDAGLKERLNALLVGTTMKTKLKFGMGVKVKKNGGKKKKRSVKSKALTFGGVLKLLRSNKNVYKKTPNMSENSPCFLRSIGDMIATTKKILKGKGKKVTVPRVIRVPKTGGILPLIPIFAGLSALGSLIGGAATVAKTVINAGKARPEVVKDKSNIPIGSGMYLKPYKTGLGLYLEHYNPKN